MAKFTATVPLDIRLPGGFEAIGAAGTTHRIPDALYEEFARDVVPTIPGGVTWITQDESTQASADVTAALALKFDKAGGIISGAVTATSTLAVTGTATLGRVVLNGGGFSNAYDTDVWISGSNRTAATGPTQGYYGQHRITGNAGASVHDALAAEIRLNGISNATFLNALEASVVVSGGSVTIPDTRAITANVTINSAATGAVTKAIGVAAQVIVNASTSATVGTAYGIYVDAQTAGATNYSIYAPTGTSLLGVTQTQGDLTVGVDGTGARNLSLSGAAGQARDIRINSGTSLRWIIRANSTAESGSNVGSDLEILARTDAGGTNVTPLSIKRSNGAISISNVPIGFYGAIAAAKQTVSGSRGANAALASLLTALSTIGLVTDSSTA